MFSNGALETILCFQDVEQVHGTCSLVCKRWYHAVSSLKCTSVVRGSSKAPNTIFMGKAIVILHGNDQLVANIPFQMLTSLELSHQSGVQIIDLPLHSLKHLSLRFLRDLREITFERDYYSLTSFSIHSCSQLKLNNIISLLEKSPPTLEKFELSSMKQTIHISDGSFLMNVKRFDARLSDLGNLSILHNCTRLEYLDLSKWKTIKTKDLVPILQKNQLFTLSLWGCDTIDDSLILYLPKTLRNLNLSCCKRLTDAGIQQLECPNLVKLQLWWCNLTDDAICSLKMPQLESLNLNWAKEITDHSLSHISTFTSLSTLMLSKCSRISDRGLMQVAKACRLLQQVDIAECNNITDVSVLELSNCTNLRQLNFYRCSGIGDTSIVVLAKKLGHGLEGLNVAGTQCTDVTLRSVLLEHCTSGISVFNMSQCRISNDAVLDVAKVGCDLIHLVTLSFQGCDINIDAKEALQASLKHTKCLF